MGAALRAGVDIGSTTAKLVPLSFDSQILFGEYVRHAGDVSRSVETMLDHALDAHGDREVAVAVTGTAGMGLCERTGLPFVQELIASASVVRERNRGEALRVLNTCLQEAGRVAISRPWVMYRLLKQAIRRFKSVPIHAGEYPRIGIVGEICLHPFGCIAHHVLAKGMERRLKDLYPDAGTSEVNNLNRLHFMVEGARRRA